MASSERPKGYADWNPRPETLEVVSNVKAVLREYQAHLPLTVRQIFYRLVGAYGFEKTEKAYNRLAEYLVRARRAQMIPFSSIRDDGTVASGGGGFSGEAGFWRSVRASAEYFERDRMAPQDVSVELWCEAAGMVPQLVRATEEYSVPVYSTGGFSSVTVTHEIAQRALYSDDPVVFLHVGDFDPSGQSIFESMAKDATYFVAGELGGSIERAEGKFRPIRVALTEEQVDEHALETAPPKFSDSRSARWIGETCQAEAMPPDLLAETVRQAVESHLDLGLHATTIEEEETERGNLIDRLDRIDEEIDE